MFFRTFVNSCLVSTTEQKIANFLTGRERRRTLGQPKCKKYLKSINCHLLIHPPTTHPQNNLSHLELELWLVRERVQQSCSSSIRILNMMPFSVIEPLLVLHAIPKVKAWGFPQVIQILNVHHSLINEYGYAYFSHVIPNIININMLTSIILFQI